MWGPLGESRCWGRVVGDGTEGCWEGHGGVSIGTSVGEGGGCWRVEEVRGKRVKGDYRDEGVSRCWRGRGSEMGRTWIRNRGKAFRWFELNVVWTRRRKVLYCK